MKSRSGKRNLLVVGDISVFLKLLQYFASFQTSVISLAKYVTFHTSRYLHLHMYLSMYVVGSLTLENHGCVHSIDGLTPNANSAFR
jgi:hypothetical protein